MSTRKNESRPNAKRPGGPKNTTSTRFNAVKHAFLAAGLTELDDVDAYRSTLRGLKEKYSEELENFLLERLALHMTRLRRCAGWEAHEITAILNPPFYGEDPFAVPSLETVIDPGLPALADAERFGPLVSIFQRYETSIENKLIRSMSWSDCEGSNRGRDFQRRLLWMLPLTAILTEWIHLRSSPTKLSDKVVSLNLSIKKSSVLRPRAK